MMILDLASGLHRGIPEAVYHARVRGLASKGALDKVRRSPAHYAAWLAGLADETSDALDFGKAFHCASLEPELFAERYTIEPTFGDCRKKENKANRDAWRKENEGALLLSMNDHLACRAMAESIRKHPVASRLLEGGDRELTVRWRDEATGLECKARADQYRPDRRLVVDVKTTEDASPDGFRKSVARYGYHRQAALYREGFAAAGAPVDFFLFVAVEKVAPFAVGVYALDADAEKRGRDSVREDLAKLADCIERDVWPAYSDSILTLDLPAWAA